MIIIDIDRVMEVLQKRALVARSELQRERKAFHEARTHLRDALDAQVIVQHVAQSVQESAHAQISRVVTIALHTVFGKGSYDFRIRFDRKRGKTEARLELLRMGRVIKSPLDEDSGGVVDIAAFALRLACLLTSKPRLRRLLVLDEPFRFVSAEHRPAIKPLLHRLAKEFKIQFIIVTHQEEYITGKVVRL